MRRKRRRDATRSVRPVGSPADPRTLPRFRREVVVLLAVGHKVPVDRGVRLIRKWDRYVRQRWRQGKPPCNVADHIARFEREGLVRPSRDADDPKKGEIYETRAGNRWEVIDRHDERVDVKRHGHRLEGPFRWKKSALKPLKLLSKKEEHESFFQADPDGRRSKRKTKRCATAAKVQTLIFDKRYWTKARAKAWAKSHNFNYGYVDETTNTWRIRQLDPKRFKVVGSFPMRGKRGIRAVVGCSRFKKGR